jgi:hypothetical protein
MFCFSDVNYMKHKVKLFFFTTGYTGENGDFIDIP